MTTTHDDKAREQRRAMFRAYCECFNNGSRMTPDAIADRLLDAARAALSPASGQEANECRLTLLVQVHELCDQIERTLHTFGTDEEGRKQAEGAVAYARKVSQPFNYNGPFRAAPAQQVEAEKWISVTERLPEFYEEVMVWPHPNDMCMTAELRKDGNWIYGEYVHGHGWSAERMTQAPTHWMPLPKPPAAGSNNGEK